MTAVIIRDHWKAEDIELIIERHRILYEQEYGFDQQFGEYVEVTFQGKIERLWIAEQNGIFAGCIGVIKVNEKIAQLRWLLVEPEKQGLGLGKKLMQELIDYCKKEHYEKIILWTVNQLPTARILYERFGFHRTEQKPETLLWGQNLVEERWDLSLYTNR